MASLLASLLLLALLLAAPCGSLAAATGAAADVAGPTYPTLLIDAGGPDWLLHQPPQMAPPTLVALDARTLALSNGLLARVFTTAPDWATWDVQTSRGSALRAISPEAFVTLDNRTYQVGGLVPLRDDGMMPCPLPAGVGPADNCPTAYFNRSTPYGANASAFHYLNHSTSRTLPKPFEWSPKRHAPPVAWPPLGLRLSVDFDAPADADARHADVVVTVHYELLQGAPVLTKSLSLRYAGSGGGAADERRDHHHEHHHERQHHSHAGVDLAVSVSVPVDQQGPICIQPCGLPSPPSNWQMHWVLPAQGQVGAVRMGGAQAKCLTAVAGSAFHGWNDMLDAHPCNASDPAQKWSFGNGTGKGGSTSAQQLVFKGDANAVGGPNWGGCGKLTAGCCVDVNNHQSDSGTTLQGDGCGGTGLFEAVAGGAVGQVKLKLAGSTYEDRCMTHVPLPPPPPAPPPPPPKVACTAGNGCTVLTHAVVEVLRLNADWGPDPAIPRPLFQQVEKPTWGEFFNNLPSTGAAGLLEVLPSQGHGTRVTLASDPTFVEAYRGNNGANEPMITCDYNGAANMSMGIPIPGYPGLQYGGPAYRLRRGGKPFDSFRCIETYSDSPERERWGMGLRKRTRLLAPQSSETPQFVHLTNASAAGFRKMIDQMHVVGGFDMLIFSFGSGFNFEETTPAYLAEIKADVAYAKARGIEVGGYDLISDTRGGTGYDAISPLTHKGTGSACMASAWEGILESKIMTFVNETGISMIETDGPYDGIPCAAENHDHYGIDDSIEAQWRGQVAFYRRMRASGVFVHAPDGYLFEGGANKECGGYQEMQENLPRWQSLSINRQVVHDETFTQTPTQAWQFAPLVDYHGGSNAALEPFSENYDAWEWTLATYLGAGYGTCYRGDRLYDTPKVQAMVTKWMRFWVQYRRILTQDVVHVKRPDMQRIDAIAHVDANVTTSVCALLMVYNPAFWGGNMTATLHLPLYYTGVTDAVTVSREEGAAVRMGLRRDYSVHVNVSLPPLGITYFVVRRLKTVAI
jgi:hypothetical protein